MRSGIVQPCMFSPKKSDSIYRGPGHIQQGDLISKSGPSWWTCPVLYLDLHPSLVSLGLVIIHFSNIPKIISLHFRLSRCFVFTLITLFYTSLNSLPLPSSTAVSPSLHVFTYLSSAASILHRLICLLTGTINPSSLVSVVSTCPIMLQNNH